MKYSHFSLLLLLHLSTSTYGMDGEKNLLTTSRSRGQLVTVSNEDETLERFIERTKKLPAMHSDLRCDDKPRIQFDALKQRKIELGISPYPSEAGGSNYIRIFDKEGKEEFYRILDSNRYIAAALLSNQKNRNVVVLVSQLFLSQANLYLQYLDYFTFVPGTKYWKVNNNYSKIIGGHHPKDPNDDISTECVDFNIQGNKVIVWGTRNYDVYRVGERERVFKIFE